MKLIERLEEIIETPLSVISDEEFNEKFYELVLSGIL